MAELQSDSWDHSDQVEVMGVSVTESSLTMPESLKMRHHDPNREKRYSNGSLVSIDGPKTMNQEPLSPEDVNLPQSFVVKYLGKREARGLWGIKNTRKPVDEMVNAAKSLKPGQQLPHIQLKVSEEGVVLSDLPQNVNKNFTAGLYPIDIVSYGVQDVVYTRVFAMIVVTETAASGAALRDGRFPFECHAFVCDSRISAKRLTFALATSFQAYSRTVATKGEKVKPKKFAIDLRPPEVIANEMEGDEEDSEA
ncbi:uncharacterized protein LOC136036501 [Artemia franciscana]|uniref:PID domain-containing protein n=1 Tax=Artemia franciscana TaxID=6661 RepID=A0AA88I0J3_ARTSF|nr:hypothetical protein QYM36_004551 [Artemia franciscana]